MTEAVLQCVEYGYPGAEPVLRRLSAQIVGGRPCGVLGFSGSGKTTLLRVLGGYLSPNSGVVSIRSPGVLAKAYAPQEAGLLPWLDVSQNLELGEGLGRKSAGLVAFRRSLTDAFGLRGYLSHRPRSLSGGMRRRLAVASALSSGADLILLDEPFAGSDAIKRRAIYEGIRTLIRDQPGVLVIFATHDPADLFALEAAALWLPTPPDKATSLAPDGNWSAVEKKKLADLMLGGR